MRTVLLELGRVQELRDSQIAEFISQKGAEPKFIASELKGIIQCS